MTKLQKMPSIPDTVFVTRKWAPAIGGMETWSHKLCAEMAKLGPFEVIALPGRTNGLPPTVPAIVAFPLKVTWRYVRRRRPPTILHIGDMALWPVGLLAYIRTKPTKLILSAHGTDVSYPRRGGLRGRLYGIYLRLGARLLPKATVIANSRATKEATLENGWRSVRVIPLATDMTGPIPDGTHNGSILFAGRLIKQKGCAWFIRNVMPKLPKRPLLRVAGTGWDKDERSALNAPGVEFLGFLKGEALVHAYRKAMCVVLPNIELANGEFEGFGLVATEAAATGGVVLAARCGGLSEAVVDGRTGFLVTSGRPADWIRAINRVAN